MVLAGVACWCCRLVLPAVVVCWWGLLLLAVGGGGRRRRRRRCRGRCLSLLMPLFKDKEQM